MSTAGILEYYHFHEALERTENFKRDRKDKNLKTESDSYDLSIDSAIINELENRGGRISSGELKKRIHELTGRHNLSTSTFHYHINNLVYYKIVDKIDNGRGKKVLYLLTDGAKRLLKLRLLAIDWKTIKLYRDIYEKFFLYEVTQDPHMILHSDREFEVFLSEIGVTQKSLNWCRTQHGISNSQTVNLLYGDNIDTPLETIPEEASAKYWSERKGLSTASEIVEHNCFPLSHNLDVVIIKKQHWQVNKDSPNRVLKTEYEVTVPGISLDELINSYNNKGLKFDRTTVQDALERLKQNGLVEFAFVFQGQPRYKAKDEKLRNLMAVLKGLHEEELFLLRYKWNHFEQPTSEEKDRWEKILGKEKVKRIFTDASIARVENGKKIRTSKDVKEFHKSLQANSPLKDEWHLWPSDIMFHDYIEKREKKKIETEKRDIEIKNKKKIRFVRKKKSGTLKEIKTDKVNYFLYLKKKLNSQIESLPINLENEGIEEHRIMFSQTIDEYPFVQSFIKNISPKLFELTEEERQKGKVYDQIETRREETLRGVYNPDTKKREIEVVDLTPEYEGPKY